MFIGWMSMNASVEASSRTTLAGASRRTILQKMQSSAEAAMVRPHFFEDGPRMCSAMMSF